MSTASIIPLGNTTALNKEIYSGWMPPPQVRGTSDILYTCLITISLCIYTAIHPNIPRSKKRKLWIQRTLWVLTGIIAPECVLWTAVKQLYEAKRLVIDLKTEWLRQKSSDPMPHFDLTYGFFAAMGGIRVSYFEGETENEEKSECITPAGLKLLAKLGTFIPEEPKLRDRRSKANAFAKLVVCLEILWMSLQCITRKALGLPLSLLEIHTFVHVICATVVYTCWFKVSRSCSTDPQANKVEKPFQTMEAVETDLTAEDKHRVCLMHYKMLNPPVKMRSYSARGAFKFPTCICTCGFAMNDLEDHHLAGCSLSGSWPVRVYSPKNALATEKSVSEGYWTCLDRPSMNADSITFQFVPTFVWESDSGTPIPCPSCGKALDQYEWTMRIHRSSQLGDSLCAALSGPDHEIARYPDFGRVPPISEAVSDWTEIPEADRFITENEMWTLITLGLLSLAYGAVHLIAWHYSFPSTAEQLLWKISSFLTASSMVVYTLNLYAAEQAEFNRWMFWLLVPPLIASMVLALVLPRIFLVIESFIQIRAVPMGVYSAVSFPLSCSHH